MSYRLLEDEPLHLGVSRIAYEQIDEALGYLQDSGDALDEAVHETRKCLKKLRGLLRLVRKEIGETVYKRENVMFRDAGRLLSDLRDCKVMIDTLERAVEAFLDAEENEAYVSLHASLMDHYQDTRRRVVDSQDALSAASTMIQAARLRVEDWPVENDSYTAVAGRLHKVYERGRNRLDDASQDPSPELFHEWRKRVKYLWYNTRILRFVWPGPMEELADEIHDLADYLGDAHDITGLSTWLERRAPLATDAARMSFMAHLAKERDVLHKRAIEQGRRIYWETPHDLVERLGTYWNITRN